LVDFGRVFGVVRWMDGLGRWVCVFGVGGRDGWVGSVGVFCWGAWRWC
jgi:hypothetical protein